jgi:hypothetical protein
MYQLKAGEFVEVDGKDWNKTEGSVLMYMLRNLCSSKFTLSSFLQIAKESFDFAQTGYQRFLQGIQILDDLTDALYRDKIIPILQKVE